MGDAVYQNKMFLTVFSARSTPSTEPVCGCSVNICLLKNLPYEELLLLSSDMFVDIHALLTDIIRTADDPIPRDCNKPSD